MSSSSVRNLKGRGDKGMAMFTKKKGRQKPKGDNSFGLGTKCTNAGSTNSVTLEEVKDMDTYRI